MFEKKALIPFVMAGDPDLAQSQRAILALIEEGCSTIEIGVPFSDPLADGPVIQRSAERAARAGATLSRVLELVSEISARAPEAKIVLFTYLNPLLAYGLESYACDAKRAGAAATLTVDLPPEEASEYSDVHAKANLKTVFLASRTTSPERLKIIGSRATGFVYHVARNGVTGASAELEPDLASEVARIRAATSNPVAVGFGISTPEQAGAVSRIADAVVIGSRIVSILERGPESELRSFIRSCRKEIGHG